MKNKKTLPTATALTLSVLLAPFFAHAAVFGGNSSVMAEVNRLNTNVGVGVNAHMDNDRDHHDNGNNKNDDKDHNEMKTDMRASTTFNRDKDSDSNGFLGRWFGGLANWFHWDKATSTPSGLSEARNISVVNVSTSTAEIKWNTTATTTATINYGTSKSSLNSSITANTSLKDGHDVTLSGLASGTQYFFNIVSKDESGNTKTSETREFKTKTDSSVDTSAPRILFGTVISVGTNSAHVVWITNELSSSKVWVTTNNDVSTNGSATVSKSDLSYIHDVEVTGLNSGTKYYYRFGSADSNANLALSATDSFTTK